MAQAVWTSLKWKNRVKSNNRIRLLFKKPPVPASWSDYCERFNKMKPELNQEDFAATFLRFALFSGSAQQFVILGTTSKQHIQEAMMIESDQLHPEVVSIDQYENLYVRNSVPDWRAHAG
jgi:hypothetical protein